MFLSFENLSTDRFLSFFDAFLNFDLPSAGFFNFHKNSGLFLIRPFLIIGYCGYTKLVSYKEQKKIYSFLSFDNLSAEHFLNYLLANYAFLNFDLLSIHSLNFSKFSALFLIVPFFVIGDCV